MTEQEADRLGRVARNWWRSLQPRPDGSGGDPGALARLRHAPTALDAATEPATLELCRKLGVGWTGLERASVAAAVLAHVREDAPGKEVARQLAESDMSWLRFRRLMQAIGADDQVTAFRRAVALATGRSLNVFDLARSLLDWDDSRRRRWIYAYHVAPAPAGEAEDTAA